MTKKRGGTTAEARNRKNGLKKENERQLNRRAEIMDKAARRRIDDTTTGRINERTRRNDSGSQRQRELSYD